METKSLGVASIDLSILMYFHISLKDASRVLSCLERADPSLSRRVDLGLFAKAFCPKHASLIASLYSVYYAVKYNHSTNLNKVELDAVDGGHVYFHEFFPFLVLLTSLKSKDMLKFLYWLLFDGYGGLEVSTKSLMTVLVTVIADERKQSRREAVKAKMLALLSARTTGYSAFDVDALIIYNVKGGGCFTSSLVACQASVKTKFLGNAFWSGVAVRQGRLCVEKDSSLAFFDTLRASLHPTLQSEGCINRAEEEMRRYMRVLSDFIDFTLRYRYNELLFDDDPINFTSLVIDPTKAAFRKYVLRLPDAVVDEGPSDRVDFDAFESKARGKPQLSAREIDCEASAKNEIDVLLTAAREAKLHALEYAQMNISDLEKHMTVGLTVRLRKQGSRQNAAEEGMQSRDS